MADEYQASVLHMGDPVVLTDRILASGGTWTSQHTHTMLVYPVRDGLVVELADRPDGRAELRVVDTVREATHSVTTAVDSLDAGRAVLDKLGLARPCRRECARTAFTLNHALLSIDRWPGLPPLLHLSADHPAGVFGAASQLGFGINQTSPVSVRDAYARYGVDLSDHADVSFSDPPRTTAPPPLLPFGVELAEQVRVVLVTNDQRLLLIRRTRPGRPVYWQYPGSTNRAQPHETLHDTVLRTVTNQTGSTPKLVGIAGVVEATGVPIVVYIAVADGWAPAERSEPPVDHPDRATYQVDPVDLHPATLRVLDIWPAPITDLLLATAADTPSMADTILGLPERYDASRTRPGDD
ncbi:MAG TPA: NUDIX domain-containing protein [Micromonosporaceae bacterium]|nr:NUDIX domain-containing protein [Micromonosporaceae bacterium]